MASAGDDNLFTGPIGEEYDFLPMICPNIVTVTANLGATVAAWRPGAALRALEIGCGTGTSTRSLLSQRDDLSLLAVDASPAMLNQARENLASYARAGRVEFIESDALVYLRALPDASVDIVASNYAIHNFDHRYRRELFAEILRVLEPGGLFVNGDRFALDDHDLQLASTRADVRNWFKVFGEAKRYDLLEDWILHLFSDESADRLMYSSATLSTMRALGFADVRSNYREGVDMLVTATKPSSAARDID
ncbi:MULTISPECIES: class I SAM-dependent methyltransferase [unclassified Methylosinus]|uniref:class I SAM-dependent methyltransferase n=1 Tax=unclassified Methylosinus TaxID=2624500 RepID=UPI00140A50E1|nr:MULTISPECIES: class I SAM-dependent methyltransferase [unclassified Methylosinus]MBU3888745.1 class I SAM-dependent methyltransferase [Methylosinus sp. KRF6]